MKAEQAQRFISTETAFLPLFSRSPVCLLYRRVHVFVLLLYSKNTTAGESPYSADSLDMYVDE